MTRVYLGLGGNLGQRELFLRQALELLGEQGVAVGRVSRAYETEPVGLREQPRFLNLACDAAFPGTPADLLRTVMGIERTLGRTPARPNGPRVIDIDILLFGDQVLDGADLTIPHPRMTERAFVLAPLAEIAPDLRHPVQRRTVSELLAVAPGREGVRPWGHVRWRSPGRDRAPEPGAAAGRSG